MAWWLLPVALLVAFNLWRWRNARREDHMLADVCEFMRRFPDRCIFCSLHRYGVEYGFQRPTSQPEPHRCTEAK